MIDRGNSRPGDAFINRYMPNASEEDLARARATLGRFASVVLKIAARMAREELDRIRAQKAREVK